MLCVAVSRSGWLLLLPSVALLPPRTLVRSSLHRPLHVTVEDLPGSGAFLLRELVVEEESLDWDGLVRVYWRTRAYAVVHTLVPYGIFLSFLSFPSSRLSRPASGPWAYRSIFSQPCDPCVISRSVFSHHDDQRVSGGRFRGPFWSSCGGSLVLMRRLLARWLPAWILLRYCLRSLETDSNFLRCCNVEDLHQAPSASRVWADASDLCTRCCSGSGNPLCWDDTRRRETCCRFYFQSVMKQDADIRENLYAIIVFMRGKMRLPAH